MAMFVDHYLVLGLPTGEKGMRLTESEISKAFKAKALEVHPDKRPPDQAAAAKLDFQNLKASQETLIDPEKRQEFDAFLLAHLRSQQQRQQQWRRVGIPKRPNTMPNYGVEERKKRRKVQNREELSTKIKEKVSKFFAEMEKILEEHEKEEAAAEAKSRNASKTKPSATETTRLPTQGFPKFFNQDINDSLRREKIYNAL